MREMDRHVGRVLRVMRLDTAILRHAFIGLEH